MGAKLKYNVCQNDGVQESVTVFLPKSPPLVATRDHPNFDKIVDGLEARSVTPDGVRDLLDLTNGVKEKFMHLSGRVTVRDGQVFFDGDRIDNALSKSIAAFYLADEPDFMPLVAFLEKVMQNPDAHSRKNLYRWLSLHRFAIAKDGDFIAYKGVHGGSVLLSGHGGGGIVNGEQVQGRVPNMPGTIIEMQRSRVQHAPSIGCSTGLHVGNWGYASTFADVTVRVKVNPRDVVSVPTDCEEQKMRVCRYKVLDRVTAEDTSLMFAGADPTRRVVKKKGAPKKARASAKVEKPGKLPRWFEQFNAEQFRTMPWRGEQSVTWLAGDWGVSTAGGKDATIKRLVRNARTRLATW